MRTFDRSRRRAESLLRTRPRRCQARGGLGGVRALPAEQLDDPAGDVGVVEREVPCTPAHTTTTSSPCLARGVDDGREVEERRDEHALAALRPRPRPRASRSSSRGSSVSPARLEVLARRVPEVEARDAHGVPLAAEDALAELVAQRTRLLHLGRAEHPLVARASAWQIVEVARITSMTIPVGALRPRPE